MKIPQYMHNPRSDGMGLFAGEVAEWPRVRRRIPLFLSFVTCTAFFGMLVMAAVMIGAR